MPIQERTAAGVTNSIDHKPLVHLTVKSDNQYYISIAVQLQEGKSLEIGDWDDPDKKGEGCYNLQIKPGTSTAGEIITNISPEFSKANVDEFYVLVTDKTTGPNNDKEHKCALLYQYAEEESAGHGGPGQS